MYITYLKFKNKFFGLTPLQQYVYDNESEKPVSSSPFLTYLYFLTYEDVVLRHKNYQAPTDNLRDSQAVLVGRAPKDRYEDAVKALRFNSKRGENTDYKTFLHVMSIAFVAMLMLAASAVSTASLMGVINDYLGGLGAYEYVAQTFFYGASAWAQWMIFRKNVPRVLKNLFYIDFTKSGLDAWHYTTDRELMIEGADTGAQLSVHNNGKTFEFKKWKLFLFSICTLTLALSLGMIVLDKAKIFENMHMSDLFVTTVMGGNFEAFLGILCVVYILSHFALFISAVLNHLRENENNVFKKELFPSIKGKWRTASKIMLAVMCGFSMFGLISTVSSQTKSTFDKWGLPPLDSLGNSIAGDELIAGIALFTLVAAAGRAVFNIKAMGNLYSLVTVASADAVQSLREDMNAHKMTYIFGALLCAGVGLVVWGIETGQLSSNPLWHTGTFMPEGLATPIGLALASAAAIFTVFKMGAKYFNPSLGKNESAEINKPYYMDDAAEMRSGQQLVSVITNSVTSGAIGFQGMEVMIKVYSDANNPIPSELKTALLVAAMIASGLVSMASALNSVTFSDKKYKAGQEELAGNPKNVACV